LFATVTLLVASPVFAGRAQILVRAEFASHSFNDKVNGQKKIWEQDFATRLADRIKPLIGFADWTAEADPAKPIAGSLVVRLTEEGGGDLPASSSSGSISREMRRRSCWPGPLSPSTSVTIRTSLQTSRSFSSTLPMRWPK